MPRGVLSGLVFRFVANFWPTLVCWRRPSTRAGARRDVSSFRPYFTLRSTDKRRPGCGKPANRVTSDGFTKHNTKLS